MKSPGKQLIQQIKDNLSFLLPYLFFLIISLIIVIAYQKPVIHITINEYHQPELDLLFKYITYLGDGIMVALATLALAFVRYYFAVVMLLSNLLASGITQTLKRTVFSEFHRPQKFFENIYDLYFVPGVEVYHYHSMPSGHTTTAFCVFFCLTLFTKNRTLGYLFFFLAAAVGFSRVYLSQHFLQDICLGSFIGTACALLVFSLFENSTSKRQMEGSLRDFFR